MAIRTDRAQVSYRVHPVLAGCKGKWLEVVDMNEVSTDGAVALLEAEVADRANSSIVLETCGSGLGVPLVGVER
jgi:hypothetical protein